MEQLRFIEEYLRVTQGYGLRDNGTIIADGTSSHDGSYAIDLGGQNKSTLDWCYTGCTLEVCRHYRGSGYNAVWYTNVYEVQTAQHGVIQPKGIVLLLLHANDNVISELGIKVGKRFNPGDKIYKKGTGGGVAAHTHLELGKGPFTGTGWKKNGCSSKSYGEVWEINNKVKPHEYFILGNDVTILPNESWVEFPYSWTYDKDINKPIEPIKPVEPKNDIPYVHPDSSPVIGYATDWSMYQTIDESKLNINKYEVILLRAVSSNTKGIYIDPKFDDFYNIAKKYNKKVGAYIYTYAFNTVEAEEEIQMFLKAVNGKSFEYPIFIDFEDKIIAPNGKKLNREILDYFVKRLNELGFNSVGVYSGTNWVQNYISIEDFNGPVWMADYRGYCGYKGRVDIWQYGGDVIEGISSISETEGTDANNIYRDLTIDIKVKIPNNNNENTSASDNAIVDISEIEVIMEKLEELNNAIEEKNSTIEQFKIDNQELQKSFLELKNNYNILKSQYDNLKKDYELLKKKPPNENVFSNILNKINNILKS